ncbi:hypothetical protein GCM10022280_05520 [Sphingomonas swuensis]|uniref:Thioredoxin-like fold domain-containing protein n=1 Tax=Sphingomonas swuensis TaxID=977800 RepID=A0ABP7SF73_9SPHN
MLRSLLALSLLVLLGAAAPPKDWRTTGVESVAGWTFGRPGAPLLSEYASFGCPHCALFSEGAGPTINARVKAGKLRLSWRPFLIFPHDRAAAVLARCVPAPRRLAFIEALMADQKGIKARLADGQRNDAIRQRLYEAELRGPEAEAAVIADVTGLDDLAVRHGLSGARASTCLASAANHSWVTNADLTARTAGVTSTPTFFLAGKAFPGKLTPEELVAALPR